MLMMSGSLMNLQLSAGGAGAGRPQELVAGGGRDERRGGREEYPQPEAQRRRRGGAGRQVRWTVT